MADPCAISFILGENAYGFPKPYGVQAWFRALPGEGILWVKGISLSIIFIGQEQTPVTHR
jgi:hypothetical protein